MGQNKKDKRKFWYQMAPGLLLSGALLLSVGCNQHENTEEVSYKNVVQLGDSTLARTIGSSQHEFAVIAHKKFQEKLLLGEIIRPTDLKKHALFSDTSVTIPESEVAPAEAANEAANEAVNEAALIFGLPLHLLKQEMVVGSVIVQVSDHTSEDIGRLKLSDIQPFQAILVPKRNAGGDLVVAVVNCNGDCTNLTNKVALMSIPVTGLDQNAKKIYLDLAKLGADLDLMAIRKNDPDFEKFKSKTSQTVFFDFSQNTLVFDVVTKLIGKYEDVNNLEAKETVIKNRWYFKIDHKFNPSFVSRKAVAGVGFFMTDRSPSPWVQRWDFDRRETSQGIKYYIKHVPLAFQAAFAGSFDEWNDQLLPIIGKRVFNYEFLAEDDPRNDLLVTGDIRYNILEWDLIDKASYGGLGPSVANQYTGETFQANVLIQGPTIVELYTKWFNANQTASRMRESGRADAAEAVLAVAHREISKALEQVASRTFEMKMGNQLKWHIRSQDPTLQDLIMSKEGFEPIPEGYTYENYMPGYFHDMITHELGHNLGLRHNFKGNLGAAPGAPTVGQVSRSIMEYLGRSYRYLDHLGDYDRMAIAYGYTGVLPEHTDWYCTDEDATNLDSPDKSAECSSSDATEDPFGYFVKRLNRVTDLVVARGSSTVPSWSLDDVKDQLKVILVGLGSYVVSADQTAKTWLHFFNHEGRPTDASGIKAYVAKSIQDVLCGAAVTQSVAEKATEEAKKQVQMNWDDLRNRVSNQLSSVFSRNELACNSL